MKAWRQLMSCLPKDAKKKAGQEEVKSEEQAHAIVNSATASPREEEDGPSVHAIHSGHPGPNLDLPSDSEVHLSVNANVLSSLSGPDGGIDVLRSCAPDLQLPWNKGTDWAYGSSISMYDANITAGKPTRSGDPIADCFSVVAYKGGALLVVADGVSWGEPARRAARCAVLGATHHLHKILQQKHRDDPGPTCSVVFHEMMAAVHVAQTLILQQCGTLTTLVMTAVLKVQGRNAQEPSRWAALTLTVGDSLAFVYRVKKQTVQELTYTAHKGSIRSIESTPGALGHSLGEEPDLSNMTASTTLLSEGDIVFLATDGVTDNFDPSLLKLAKPALPPKDVLLFEGSTERIVSGFGQNSDPFTAAMPALSPEEMHAKAMELLLQAIKDVASKPIEQVVSAQLAARFVVSLEGQVDSGEAEPGSALSPSTVQSFGPTNSFKTRHGSLNSPQALADSPYSCHGPMSTSIFARKSGTVLDAPKSMAAVEEDSNCNEGNKPQPLVGSFDRSMEPPRLPGKLMDTRANWRSSGDKSSNGRVEWGSDAVAADKPAAPVGPLTARALVDGLLQHVYKVTEPLRLQTAAASAASLPRCTPLPSLLPTGAHRAVPAHPHLPQPDAPGKLDHATIVAYSVGDR